MCVVVRMFKLPTESNSNYFFINKKLVHVIKYFCTTELRLYTSTYMTRVNVRKRKLKRHFLFRKHIGISTCAFSKFEISAISKFTLKCPKE